MLDAQSGQVVVLLPKQTGVDVASREICAERDVGTGVMLPVPVAGRV